MRPHAAKLGHGHTKKACQEVAARSLEIPGAQIPLFIDGALGDLPRQVLHLLIRNDALVDGHFPRTLV
jgi:hypothetical protein